MESKMSMTVQPTASSVDPHIERYDHARTLRVARDIIRFTPTEYRLLLLLLEYRPVPDSEFYSSVFRYQQVDAHARINLDKHIDNIRSKLRPHGFDVFRVLRYNGYMFGPAVEEMSV